MWHRRKYRRKLKVPFLKLKVNRKTWFNIIGFILFVCGVLLFLSFIQDGEILYDINTRLTDWFGITSLIAPLLLILYSAHFFNTKKLKFIKFNISLGLTLIFVALLGSLKTGLAGFLIYDNLQADFSLLGAYLIIALCFIVGLILFLNTSVDVFLLFLITAFKKLIELIQKYIFRSLFVKKDKDKDKDKGEGKSLAPNFITDKKPMPAMNMSSPVVTPGVDKSQLSIKPLSKETQSSWVYPPLSLLADIDQAAADRGDVKQNSHTIESTLESFGIKARVEEVNRGPTVTQYALAIVQGTKLSKITSLSNDLALALAATTGQVRIEAPIPGRSLVGIEIPNKKAEIVTLKRLLTSPAMTENHDTLLAPLGLDVSGDPLTTTIEKMPHILIAGTTGSGKSVLLNSWICSFLFRTKPEDLRLIMVDPKRVELSLYNGIPHLLTEVIIEPDKIISALKWTVQEMENRYKIFAKAGARNIESYNKIAKDEKMPYIIFIIDELADLMIFAPGDAEELITRIAQMARATGIHLILATQRPSVDVITGLMKANIPARIAFNVASMIDSRVVLDMPGAEKLLGKGDMLYLPPDQAKPKRIQGPFITEKEVQNIVNFLKNRIPQVHYTEEVITQDVSVRHGGRLGNVSTSDKDPFFNQAINLGTQLGHISASLLQRRLSIGYARAARIIDQLETEGYVGPITGSKARDFIIRREEKSETGETA